MPRGTKANKARIAAQVQHALARSKVSRGETTDVLHAIDRYLTQAEYDKDDLITRLTHAVGEDAAMKALEMAPPAPGLVWCCSTLGWVTPEERFDHRWDAYSDMG